MSNVNPSGTMFLGLIEELMDIVKDPNNSSVEVILAGFDLDAAGQKKLVEGKNPVSIRSFEVENVDKAVQTGLRTEFEAVPLTLVMIAYTSQTAKGSEVRTARFAAPSDKKDTLAETALIQYAERHPPK